MWAVFTFAFQVAWSASLEEPRTQEATDFAPLARRAQARSLSEAAACEDNGNFVDALQYRCEQWAGWSCLEFDGFSEADMRDLRENCQRSCGLCGEVSDELTSARLVLGSLSLSAVAMLLAVTLWKQRSVLVRAVRRNLWLDHGFGEDDAELRPAPGEGEEYIRVNKLNVRRGVGRVVACGALILTFENFAHGTQIQNCSFYSMPQAFARDCIVLTTGVTVALLLLPKSLLGTYGGSQAALAANILVVLPNAMAFDPYDILRSIGIFRYTSFRLALLVCLELRHASLALLLQLVIVQISYYSCLGADPIVVAFHGACFDVTKLAEDASFSIWIDPNRSTASPWSCLVLQIAITAALRAMMTALCDCTVFLDKDWIIRSRSTNLAALLLHNSNSMQGKMFEELLFSKSDWNDLRRHVSEPSMPAESSSNITRPNQESHMFHTTLRDATGTGVPVMVFWAQSTDLNGCITYTFGINEVGDRSGPLGLEPTSPSHSPTNRLNSISETVVKTKSAGKASGSNASSHNGDDANDELYLSLNAITWEVLSMSLALHEMLHALRAMPKDNLTDWFYRPEDFDRFLPLAQAEVNLALNSDNKKMYTRRAFLGESVIRLSVPGGKGRKLNCILELQLDKAPPSDALEGYTVKLRLHDRQSRGLSKALLSV